MQSSFVPLEITTNALLPCTAPIGVLICVCSSPSFPTPNNAFVGTEN